MKRSYFYLFLLSRVAKLRYLFFLILILSARVFFCFFLKNSGYSTLSEKKCVDKIFSKFLGKTSLKSLCNFFLIHFSISFRF